MSAEPARQWQFVARCDEIPVREGRRVCFGDREVALFNLGDAFLAIDNRCPHRRGPLADGIVAGTAVFCPLHAWKISLETGQALSGGEGGVRTYPVRVADGHIYIALNGPQAPSVVSPSGCAAACPAASDS